MYSAPGSRRSTLINAAAAVVGLSASRLAFARATQGTVHFGLILKMKEDLQTNWQAALARVAGLGIKEVEFPGTLGNSAAACRKVLDELGIRALGGGSVYKDLVATMDEVLETSAVLGKRYVYCYWPWLDGGKDKTADDWKRLAGTMNHLGARVKRGGLTLAYHNHDMEFLPIANDARVPFDLLLEHTDPSLVTMQLDLWWVNKAKASPVPFMKRHPGRFASFHIKEPNNTPEAGMACDGGSFTNIATILRAGKAAGVKHFVIENEDPKDHYKCAARTLGYLKSLHI
ncbi:MAG: TIM barrel protein [Deltaproteobacteria bacterium]|nr:TIM barrel protein [Deltaproteobacteria bacterium]